MRLLLHFSVLLWVFSLPIAAATNLVDVTESPSTEFLCPEAGNPDKTPEKRYLRCAMATARFAGPPPAWSGSLIVLTYNAERGIHLDEQIKAIRQHPVLSRAGLLLVTELDRYCSRSGNRDTARDLAKALQMNMVYGVQFVELPRPHKDPDTRIDSVCEHGQAILSPYPLQNPVAFRHQGVSNPYIPPGPQRENKEPRLGGVLALLATLKPGDKALRAAMVHLDVGQGMNALRLSEANEILSLLKKESIPTLAGGDFNTIPYKYQLRSANPTEPVVRAFLDAGYLDTHQHLPPKDRPTTTRRYLERFVLDLIWTRGLRTLRSGVGEMSIFHSLSDHLPVWTELQFP